ncbi:MAG TPA: DUF2786 domain-containing protein [Verrucomicrobiae bacterium]|nr:DUF2786 domain-containing protein [Verrucomicrobiae bacterium]
MNARIRALLRLADRGANGFPAERQLALDRALDIARKVPVAIEELLEEHRIDLSDLRCPPWRLPREGSAAALSWPFLMAVYGRRRDPATARTAPYREECAGVYPVADFGYYVDPENARLMAEGDPVQLLATSGHPAGRFTVVVTWRDMDIGLIPPGRNVAIWRRRWARLPLEAWISRMESGPDGCGAVEIEIR